MKSLLIIGAGGYGQHIKEIAELCGYSKIEFLDDNSPCAIGKIDEWNILQDMYNGCIIAIGNPETRKAITEKINHLHTLIHPDATISRSATIGDGCVIEAYAAINSNVKIMKSSYICAGAIVNHDAVVNSYCQVDCNAVVASGAIVPEKTKVQSCTVWTDK